jgi:PKD repeat protein
MKSIFTFLLLLLIGSNVWSQTNITIGTGTQVNSPTTYPAPYGNWYWGAKHQILITATELNAAGMSSGNILGLSFNVQNANGTPLSGFQIRIGTTALSQFGGGTQFQGGLTSVFGPANYTESNGLNFHTFSSPYFWDGVSNLIIETCFNNSQFTNNAQMRYTQTGNNTVIFNFQDASGVCSAPQQATSNLRPNIVFQYQVPNIPPVAGFNASATSTCSGDVTFFDNSFNNPTSWLWNFGDGNTSTVQNPSHTYTTTGQFTVSLTATNAFGSNTETKTNYIDVNLSGNTPISASCIPMTQDGSLGFGITNVTFNSINKNSGNASEGYSDFTCDQTTVYAGQTYSFSATHSAPTFHNCKAWIDWNNDGVFNPTTELIASSTSANGTSASVVIPSNAVLNTALRMRVIADYDLSTPPGPCVNPQYGQSEDYTVFVEQLQLKPEANFTSNKIITCDGTVNFSDLSTNIPNAWAWEFGDGGISVAKNPTYTYTTDGVYTVQLIATNTFGSDTIILTDYITVDLSKNLIDAACTPITFDHCCGYGIYKVEIANINNSTIGAEEGYQDYSCEHNTKVAKGGNYSIEVRTGTSNPQDTKVWIDYNNDGIFDNPSELVFTSLNSINPIGNISIPTGGVVEDTYLRMRVSSTEIGGTLNGCNNHQRGQTEDYGIFIEGDVSVSEVLKNKVKVYPNPSDGIFNITSQNEINNIVIYNLVGQNVYQLVNFKGSNFHSLDLTHLSKGTYFIQLTDSNEGNNAIATEKIIIQ